MDLLLFYFTGVFTVTSILIIWFMTDFPSLIFALLKKLGVKKSDPDFWDIGYGPNHPITVWTEDDRDRFYLKLGLLGHLLGCRFCFSCHLILWVNIITWIMTLILTTATIPLWFICVCIATQLPFVHIVYNYVNKG